MLDFDQLNYDGQLDRLTRAARQALLRYGLNSVTLDPITYYSNAVFRVTAGESVFKLRLHRPGQKRPQWIRSELIWLEALRRETRLNVPQSIPAQNGAPIVLTPVEGLPEPATCVLSEWIQGRVYEARELTIAQVEQVGLFLAALHNHSVRYQPPPAFARPRLDAEGLFGADSPYNPGDGTRIFTPAQREVFAAVADRVQAVMQSLGQSPETFGLIHADFLPKNYLFNEAGIAAIDFDDCAWGYYLYDLAPPLLWFKLLPDYAERRDALLAGYTRLRPLPDSSRSSLETFIAARLLASCRWQAANLHNPRIREGAAATIATRAENLQHFLDTGIV